MARDLFHNDVEIEAIFETEHDHYQIISIGWNNQQRIYSPMIHLDIKNEKIWIHQNTTEIDVALELMEINIPKQDIVLGFNTPKMPQLLGFALE